MVKSILAGNKFSYVITRMCQPLGIRGVQFNQVCIKGDCYIVPFSYVITTAVAALFYLQQAFWLLGCVTFMHKQLLNFYDWVQHHLFHCVLTPNGYECHANGLEILKRFFRSAFYLSQRIRFQVNRRDSIIMSHLQ